MGLLKKEKLFLCLIFLLFYTLFPFIIISIFNHPSADDFFLVLSDKNTSFWEIQINHYLNWSGRYFSRAAYVLNPLLYSSMTLYKWYPIILITLFLTSLFLLIGEIFKNAFTLKHILSIVSILIFLYFSQMPCIPEGFYWFSGYIGYQPANILTLLFLLVLVRYNSVKSSFKRFVLFVVMSILVVAVIGSNEISLLIICAIIFLKNIIHYSVTRGYDRLLAGLLLVSLISCLLYVLAPGNYARMQLFEYSGNLLFAFSGSLFLLLTAFFKWGAYAIIASALYILFFGVSGVATSVKNNLIFNVDLRVSLLFYFTILYLSYFIPTWATGGTLALRAENVTYLFFILGWFYNLQLILIKYVKDKPTFNGILYKLTFSGTILLFILNVFDINNHISTAYVDLLSGKASNYNKELQIRYNLILNSHDDTITLPPLSGIPKTIFFTDLSTKTDSITWNNTVARYFNKSYVFLHSLNPEICSNSETLKKLGKQKRKEWIH